jgi:hypothetical protein
MAWRLRWFKGDGDADAAGWPVGGIWRSGASLLLITPVGLADIARWEQIGPDEKLTTRPSILCQGEGVYHGYVTDGVLTDDCEGRLFPDHPATA